MIKIYNKNSVILNTQDKYCNENIEVAIDTTDLTPENIVKGKRILGIDGTAEAGGGEIPEGYIKPEGTIEITENGTVDVTSYASAEINVPTGGVTPKGEIIIEAEGTHDVTEYASAYVSIPKQQKTVTPTKSEQRVWPDSGRLLSGVTVNAIPDEYIIPSGNFEITANGDYDISDKESVSVNVAGSGEGDSLWTEVMGGKLAKQDMDYALYNLVADNPDKYLQGFDTSKVTLMNHMFEYSTMTSFSTFDTSSATSMKNFCAYCSRLTDVPMLNTSKVTAANYLFYFCSSLEKLPNWDFSKVKEFNYAFSKIKITEAVIDTSSANNISSMFEDCNYLKKAEISTMDAITSQYNVSSYCKYCYSLQQFIIRNMTKLPVFYNSSYAYPFKDCYHFGGTFHSLFNPEALDDGGIYVPDEWVDSLKAATGWSYYGDYIYPLSQLPESLERTDMRLIRIEKPSVSGNAICGYDQDKRCYKILANSYSKFCFYVPESSISNSITLNYTAPEACRFSVSRLDEEPFAYDIYRDGYHYFNKTLQAGETGTVRYENLPAGEHYICITAATTLVELTITIEEE